MPNNAQQNAMQEMLDKAAEVIAHCGIANLNDQSPPGAVMWALTQLGQFCAGLDRLFQETIAATAIAILKNSCQYPTEEARRVVRAAMKQTVVTADEDAYQTFGEAPGGEVIIDLVQDRRALKWVVARPGTGKVSVTDTVDGRVMWPRPCLPWKGIPHARDVERAWGVGPSGRALFLALTDVFRHAPPEQLMILPEPPGVWAALLALWVMGTYLQHWFKYYSVLLLEGPPARGKSRLGNAVVFLARRGMATASPTTAVIFRNRARHMVSLFIDVRDLPGLMERKQEVEELILAGMERGKAVQRVLRPDAPTPPEEMKDFAVFGPLILASNRDVPSDHPLASRCVRIAMPEAGSHEVEAALSADDARVLTLRAQLVAWAAVVIAEGTEPPPMPRMLTGRLHDIASPLLQIARLVYPEVLPALVDLLRGTEQAQRQETADSREGRVVKALIELRAEGQWPDTIGYQMVADRVNEHVEERDQLSIKSIGWVAKHLGFKKKPRGGYKYIVYPGDEVMQEHAARYDLKTTHETHETP